MEKDAYYFPHFCNARHDRKIQRIRKELGLEGYGIFFMLLETLRDQLDFKYPIDDIDLLADEFGTSEQKLRCVITNYQLFQIEDDGFFFSPKQIFYLTPYINMKEQRSLAGKKSGEVRALLANTPAEIKNDLPQVYIIICYNETEKFIKIGSTNKTISRRFSGHLPYQYKVVRQFFTEKNLELESEIMNEFSNSKYTPKIIFSGNAECINYDQLENIITYKPTTYISHEHVFEQCSNENKQSKGKEKKVKEKKIIIMSDVDSVYSMYPTVDINNSNKSTGKSSKDKEKIFRILTTEYPLRKAIEFYLAECSRTKCYLKNFGTFLNNLPDESLFDGKIHKKELTPEQQRIKNKNWSIPKRIVEEY